MDRTDLHQADLSAPRRVDPPAPAPRPKGEPAVESGRRLCSTERGIWKFDQAASMNTAAAVRVRGPLDEAVLRAG
ncbi:MAG TPA: hypothetical protein VFS00_17380, partial [Polyangiaceae bacterium]|nr:hypothetical protein [Polyangiaceae bacterium]